MGFLDEAGDNGLIGGLASFGQGLIKGMQDSEDRRYKRMEIDAKMKANQLDKEKQDAQRSFEQTEKLRDDWLQNSVTKSSQTVKQAYDKIRMAPQTAGGDMSLIYGFMRIQDPGSTVREGEFANAQNTAGIPDQIRNLYNKALTGQRLNPQQRQDFIKTAASLVEAQRQNQNNFDTHITDVARRSGAKPENIVYKIFEDTETGEQKVMPVAVPAQAPKKSKGLVTSPGSDQEAKEKARLQELLKKKASGG